MNKWAGARIWIALDALLFCNDPVSTLEEGGRQAPDTKPLSNFHPAPNGEWEAEPQEATGAEAASWHHLWGSQMTINPWANPVSFP